MKIKALMLALILGGMLMTSCGEQPTTVAPTSEQPTTQQTSGDGMSNTPNVLMDKTFYNPLDITKGVGDPWLYKHTDGYYYYTHSCGGVVKVTKTESPSLLREDDEDETRTKVIFRQKSIDVIEIWAPEVFFYQGHWYCYFTATTDGGDELAKDTRRRTYGMKSKTDDMFGEWETAVKVVLPDDFRSIDATFFEYKEDIYICYAGWPAAENQKYRQHLYINKLVRGNPLLVDPSETERHKVSEPLNKWEIDGGTCQNEGPTMTFAPDGTPVLFYSGAYSGSDSYCICYLRLTGNDILNYDDWTKCEKPLMATDMAYSEVIAPGHNSIIKSPDGTEDWICYHAAKLSGSGWDRQIRLQKFTWDGNYPVVDKIYKASDEAPLPSGDPAVRYKFEAEHAQLTNAYAVEKAGFASNDNAVSIAEGGNIKFEVAVKQNGKYAIGVRYSNRDSASTKIDVNVNGANYELFAPNTMYDDSFFMSWFFADMYLKPSGQNVITITADTAIYVDAIVVDYLNHK